MKLLNTDIIANPYNWATVLLMALFGLFALALIFTDQPE